MKVCFLLHLNSLIEIKSFLYILHFAAMFGIKAAKSQKKTETKSFNIYFLHNIVYYF